MIVMLVVAVYHVYLPADLAACRVRKRVHVRIGGTGSDERDDRFEITSGELLTCRAPGYEMSANVIVPVKSSDPGTQIWGAGPGLVAVWQSQMTMLPFTLVWAIWMWACDTVPCSPL